MRRRTYKRKGFRARRKVSWLTQPNLRGTLTLTPGSPERFSIGLNDDNDFITNHPRFAKRNDIVPVRRIVGDIRISMYDAGTALGPRLPDDAIVEYGLCFVDGDYDDSGVWTATTALPDPSDPSDEDKKWLFKNRVVLSFGQNITYALNASSGTPLKMEVQSLCVDTMTSGDGTLLIYTQNLRPHILSTDQQLPMGSKVDISTRRKTEYGEKLSLICNVKYEGADVEDRIFYADYAVRALIAG